MSVGSRLAASRAWTLFLRLPEGVRVITGGIVVVAAGMLVLWLLGIEAPAFILVLGALIGLSYGLLAVTLVLVFRVTGVVNFAQPAIGSLCAVLLPILSGGMGLPYWLGFPISIIAGFALGAMIDFVVIRRFEHAPRVVVAAVTIGSAVVLTSAAAGLLQIDVDLAAVSPPGLFQFTVGPLVITKEYTGLILAAPLLALALTLFMTRTRIGLGIRASAANAEAASLAGISPRLMTAVAWGIAGACSTTLAVFFGGAAASAPQGNTHNFTTTFSDSLFSGSGILPALAAAAIARMTSYARALVAGVCLGMLEQVILWSDDYAGQVDVVFFLVILVALLLLKSVRGRGEPTGAWAAVSVGRPLPRQLSGLWSVRALPAVVGVLVFGLVAWQGLSSEAAAYTWTPIVAAALIAASAGMITGLAGDLSLGQYGVAAVGAAATFLVLNSTGSEALALLAAAVVGGLISVALAYPGLRIGGLTLTILTASFAAMMPAVLRSEWMFGASGSPIGQPVIGGWALDTARPYLVWALTIAGLLLLIGRNVWHSGFGKTAIAARDNESAARAFSISTTRVQLQLFFVAGAIAGVAGSLVIQASPSATATAFPPDYGALVVLAVILGGAGAFYGGAMGTLWVLGLPLLTLGSNESTTVVGIFTAALALLLAFPRGLAEVCVAVRDIAAVGLGRLHGVRVTLADVRGVGRPDATAEPASSARDASLVPDDSASSDSSDAADDEPTLPASDTATVLALAEGAKRSTTRGLAALPMLTVIEAPERRPIAPDGIALAARGLEASFGPIRAVRSVDIDLREGEILGIIGPNGAGKTTTFEMLAGFVRPDAGTVEYYGTDITSLPPDARAGQGLVRSFQDAALFPTMTVLDVLSLSLERQQRSGILRSLSGLGGSGRLRRGVAHDLVQHFGLGRFSARTIGELSTGTRRIVELACLTSLQPRVLLLDEPTAGIAQRETEAMAVLIANIHKEFEMTIALIEHDLPFVTSLADRMVAMAEGNVISSGTPKAVCQDPLVIDCYLGIAGEAVNRSDLTTHAG